MSIKTTSIMVWGHRGHRHHRYSGYETPPHENSLRAYHQVLDSATGLECDVVQSKQSTPFLVHDTLFNGITKYELKAHLDEASKIVLRDRYIFQLNDDELDQMKLKDGQSLPRLHELLKLMKDFPDRNLYLELKGPSVADSTMRVIERAIRDKHIHPDQIILCSYNLPTLQSLRQNVGTRFKISAMLTPADLALAQMYPNWPNAEQNAYYVPFSLLALQRSDIQEIQPDLLNIECGSLTEDSVEAIHALYPDAKLVLWQAGEQHPNDDASYVDKIAEIAETNLIFAVISDFPDMLQKKLTERGIDIQLPHNPYRL